MSASVVGHRPAPQLATLTMLYEAEKNPASELAVALGDLAPTVETFIVVDHGISGQYVARVLDRAGRFRELPRVIRTDQGPEFTGKALDQWAYERGITLRLIQAKVSTGWTRTND
jgi:transposase InsO family protein